MPRRGDRPRPRVHAALARIGLTLVLAVAACGEGPLPRPAFSVTAEPERPFAVYGEIVPVRFTVRNDTGTPVILEKVEGLTGRRRVLAVFRETDRADAGAAPRVVRFRAVLPVGGTYAFTAPIRCLGAAEDLLLLASPFRLEDMKEVRGGAGGAFPAELSFPLDALPGHSGMARAEARYAGPPPPFEPPVSTEGAWSYSPVLAGFVLRLAGGGMQLTRADGPAPLPDMPFDFLDDVEGAGAATVLLESGDVVPVTPDSMSGFLADLVHRGRRLGFSDEPDKARYQVQE